MNIHTIDLNFRSQPQSIAAYLLQSGGELALVETGPTSTIDALLAGIRGLGYDPAAIRTVLVTHVHLDHAGAAGWWAARGARIYVHHSGARHLADPARLVEGARMVYGDRLHALWGEIAPVAGDRLQALGEGDVIPLGPSRIQAWDTPGHAWHHMAFVVDGLAFTGDVAGVRIPGSDYISPATAPSQFDPDAYKHSIQRLRKARLDRLYLTHFGAVDDSDRHLSRYARIIDVVTRRVDAWLQKGMEPERIMRKFTVCDRARSRRADVSDAEWSRYENANASTMCAQGILHYLQKRIYLSGRGSG